MPGLVDVLCGHPEYSLCARRSILLLFCFFAKTCSCDSKSNGIRMPDDREAGRHAPRSHAKFKRAPMQFQYFHGGFGTPRTPHARPLLKKFLSHPFLTWPRRAACVACACQITPSRSRRRYGVDVMHREATADARQR